MIYIHKNNQQTGPYEEHVVLDQLKSGFLKPEDLAIRQGDSQWEPLRTMFPQVVQIDTPRAVAFAAPGGKSVTAPSPSTEREPQYRRTVLQKVFFGLCFLGAIGILAATVYYIFTFGSSGNLEADLSRLGLRDLGKYLAIGTFVGGFFMFLAFLLSFKRKLIRSNGARMALRVFFVLVVLAGLGSAAFSAISYLTYSSPTRTKASESNELLRALEAGSEMTGPFRTAVIALPIGAGLFLFGLSGVLMAKRPRD
ncbi:MAG: DUF4339 domain-containing protein [Acidobacteriota bacterium]